MLVAFNMSHVVKGVPAKSTLGQFLNSIESQVDTPVTICYVQIGFTSAPTYFDPIAADLPPTPACSPGLRLVTKG
jgi:hypothetical protein